MGNFSQKVDKFIEIFLDQNGYVKVLQGLQNTLMIAICGLIIGIVIGTLIATVRVSFFAFSARLKITLSISMLKFHSEFSPA